MSVTVEAQNVHKSYQDGERRIEVLQGVDFAVDSSEMVAVVGPSGSGKSTLLHLLGTLDRRRLARFRNRTIGFVFQFHRLLPDFDALENVMMPGRIAGLRPRQAFERARDLLVEVGLEQRLDHFPNQLSGGERQRVALCRALLISSKRGEIGMLLTLGATAGELRRAFLVLGILLASLGLLMGGGLGIGGAWLLDRYRLLRPPGDVYFIDHIPFRIEAGDLAAVFFSAALLTILSTFYAAHRAATLDVVEALRS